MTSTNAVEIEPLANGLIDLLLQPRRHWLRKREARVAYVRDTRKKIKALVAKPWHMLLCVAFSDIEDGAPLWAVLQPWYAAIALIREHAGRRARSAGKAWNLRHAAICRRETDADATLDKAQLDVNANPDDLAALMRQRVAIREYRAILEEMEALIDERLAAEQQAA